MKTGRPTWRIKSRWISVDMPMTSIYYELDSNGRLVRIDGHLRAHHAVPVGVQQPPPPPIVNDPLPARVERPEPDVDDGACCTRVAGTDDDDSVFGCALGEWWFN
jgi:hypothetical protein